MADVFNRTLVAAVAAVACLLPACSKGDQANPEKLEKYILDAAPKALQHELEVNYDNKVKLLGYSLEPNQGYRPGKDLKLTLYWQLTSEVEEGWNLFTHVLDGAGQRLLNIDNVGPLRQWRGASQALPPPAWEVGKVYVDEQVFTMPPGRAGGRIDIVAGLWKGDKRMKIVKGPKDDEQRARVVSLRAPSPERTKPPSKSKKRKRSSSTLPQLQVYKLEAGSTIAIDGLLNEPAWKLAGTTRQFVDVKTGKKNKKSPIDGRVKLTYDDEALYLGFELKDSDIRGGFDKQAKDPHLWTKDTVEIMVDPDGDGDNKDYYEIQISPQNLVFDSRFDTYNKPKGSKDGPFGHEAWSAGLTSAVTINGTLDRPKDKDTGYVVEAKLPWKAFDKAQQIPPKVGDVWRMNFYALSSNDAVAWSPILGKGNFHKAARFGRVVWKQERSSGSPRPLAPSRLLGPMGTRGRTPLQNSRDERLRSNPEKRRLPPNPAASAE